MTATSQSFTVNGTFTAPATLLHGGITFSAYGAPGGKGPSGGGTGGAGALVTGGIAMAASGSLTIYPGTYHLGGAGGTSSVSGNNGGPGGGSSAIVQGGTVMAEAAGGGGAYPSNTYGFGGAGGQPGGDGNSQFGGGGGGGANGTTPGVGGASTVGAGANGTAGGAAGTTNGGAGGSASNPNGAGGGGGGGVAGGGGGGFASLSPGGFGGGGGGSSMFSGGVTSGQITGGASTGFGSVYINYSYADPPFAPSQLMPTNGATEEMNTVGPTFSWQYNPGTDSGSLNGWAMRRKVGTGAYNYWNATALNWTSTTPVWNASTFLTFISGNTWSYTFPTGAWTDGTTYNWSVAAQESYYNLQSTFPTDQTVSAQAAPVVAITTPGAIATGATPLVAWTFTGTTQINYRVVYYDQAQYATVGLITPGISPSTYDSGTVVSAATSYNTPSAANLVNGHTYYVFVQVQETGPISSSWVDVVTLIAYDGPAAPTLTAVAGNDPLSGQPFVTLQGTSRENMLSLVDSSFESGIGTWIAITNAAGTGSMTSVTTQALDQTHSLQIAETTASGMAVGTATGAGGYPVTPQASYTAAAFIRAAVTPRPCTVAINWYQASGSASAIKAQSLGAGVTDQPSSWTRASVIDTAPSDAAFAQIRVTVGAAGVINETHYIDEVGLFAAAFSPPWTIGGYNGNHGNCVEEFQFSDDDGATWTDVRFASAVPVNTAAQATALGYEEPPVTSPNLNLLTATDSTLWPPGLGSWAALANCTVAATTAVSNGGKGALAMTVVGTPSTSMTAQQGSLPTTATSVTPNTQYTASATMRANSASRNAFVAIQWTDAYDNVVATSTSATVTDTNTGWVTATVTATCPAAACYASIVVGITPVSGNFGAGEIHYADNMSIVYNPTAAPTVWMPGAVVGQMQRIYRSRVIDNTSPAAPIPGLWSNWAQATPPPTSNYSWYLSDPSVPNGASAVEFDLQTDWKPRVHEEATRYFPIGRAFGVKSTDGMKGIGGQIETTTTSLGAWQQLMTLMQGTDTLLLQNPNGQWYITLEGDSIGDVLLATVGRIDYSSAKHLLTFMQAARP